MMMNALLKLSMLQFSAMVSVMTANLKNAIIITAAAADVVVGAVVDAETIRIPCSNVTMSCKTLY